MISRTDRRLLDPVAVTSLLAGTILGIAAFAALRGPGVLRIFTISGLSLIDASKILVAVYIPLALLVALELMVSHALARKRKLHPLALVIFSAIVACAFLFFHIPYFRI